MKAWMQRLDTVAASLLSRLPALLMLVLLAAGAWQLAFWGWLFVPTPTPDARPLVFSDGPQVIVARHWFGEVPAVILKRSGAAEAPTARVGSDDLKLLGAIAGGRRPAAVLLIGSKKFEVLLGEEFADGLRLKSVATDSVVVERQGSDVVVSLSAPKIDTAILSVPGQPGPDMSDSASSKRPPTLINRP